MRNENINSNIGTAKFDFSLFFWEGEGGLSAEFEYNTDLFERATIERWSKHLQTLLESIVANPEQRLSTLPLLSEAERLQLLNLWGITQSSATSTQCLHHVFEAHVERTPNAVALVSAEGEKRTYAEVNQKANQLAHYLAKLGIGPRRESVFLWSALLI